MDMVCGLILDVVWVLEDFVRLFGLVCYKICKYLLFLDLVIMKIVVKFFFLLFGSFWKVFLCGKSYVGDIKS